MTFRHISGSGPHLIIGTWRRRRGANQELLGAIHGKIF
jgi:hypothetical protein